MTSAEPRTWNALCDGLGLPDLRDTLHRWDDPDAVTERLAAELLKRPAQDWVAELGPRGASVVRANRGLDLPDDPHVKARGLLQRVGDLLLPRSPIRIRDRKGERPPAATFPPPSVGAHTRAVLEKTGLDAAAIDELLRSGAIGEPPAV